MNQRAKDMGYKPIKIKAFGVEHELFICDRDQYVKGGTVVDAFYAETGEPWVTLSVWVPQTAFLPKGVFYVKHYTENEEIVASLVAQGVLIREPDYPSVQSGFVTLRTYRLDTTTPTFSRKEVQP